MVDYPYINQCMVDLSIDYPYIIMENTVPDMNGTLLGRNALRRSPSTIMSCISHHIPSKKIHHVVTQILAVSCPYSRAEHIPCQNDWEISGNCADPVQVIFLFRTVCQVFLFFWHVRCRLHVFFPREDPSFEQFLMMAFSWKWSLIRTFRTN